MCVAVAANPAGGTEQHMTDTAGLRGEDRAQASSDPDVSNPGRVRIDVSRSRRVAIRVGMLGPAFVAAVAYVDPGNVAANLQAGARYGYLLVWVLVIATA